MKAIRLTIIVLLTAALIAMFLQPLMPWLPLPENLRANTILKGFPFFDELGELFEKALVAPEEGALKAFRLTTKSIAAQDDWVAFLLIGFISILISIPIGRMLYTPLFPRGRGLLRALLHGTLSLISVFLAYWLYSRFLRGVIVEKWLDAIPWLNIKGLAGQITQFVFTLGVGAIVVYVLITMFTLQLLVRKVLLPIAGSVLRTALFVCVAWALLAIARDPACALSALPLMAGAFLLGGVIDASYA